MAPSKTSWDDEETDSTPASSPPPPTVARRGKFDDEEEEDVLESWDAAEDSEEEREKAKKAAEAKAKAEAAAKAEKRSKAQRLEELREQRRRERAEAEDGESSEEEDEASRRARLRAQEMESDLKNAEDLFGGGGSGPAKRGTNKAITVQADSEDPTSAIDLSSLKLFNPSSAKDFATLRETLVPLFNNIAKKPQYELFMKEFSKQIVKEMNSEQVKKVASGLTAVSNEKLKEEKAAEKGGKKTKAAKTKTTLNAARDTSRAADTYAYDDDGLDDGDFM
ncbi:Eukaryotic translation initiation factor 3 subunit J [Cercospora beticola]|uniref:Eukaryotic translation initiation factor 3 subunit J n=1 Tax=Cercospora beticola TaxID=122368 RepID=A0A2G5HCN2_CERBT|nr:Eukaryotic translation initiation factor 3 subunit J [Cercospora beticola]PIA90324.1 Eukaryotic translation initiation factor 3 subunit J [Cercospora beticola]WPB07982.1 Translation initiation factor 3 subunit J component [Cercospora beticola]